MMPLFLSAKAQKQNKFAMDLLPSSIMTLCPGRTLYAGPGYTGMVSKSGKTGGAGGPLMPNDGGSADAMVELLHVALPHCRARNKVFEDQCFQNIGAPFEEPLADSFQEHQNFWGCTENGRQI
jgi:hypothetical protein